MPHLLLSREQYTTLGVPAAIPITRTGITFQAILAGTASEAVEATVKLYGSNDPVVAVGQDITTGASALLATFELTGTAATTGLADSGVWIVTAPYIRYWAEVSAITGVGASVDLIAAT
jgi:hypothetical protein